MSTDPNEQAHVIASTDTRAQAAETMCGMTLPITEVGPTDEGPLPGQPACGACYHEMIGIYDAALRRALTELGESVKETARRDERGRANLLDALESAEARLHALERKAKKGRRS